MKEIKFVGGPQRLLKSIEREQLLLHLGLVETGLLGSLGGKFSTFEGVDLLLTFTSNFEVLGHENGVEGPEKDRSSEEDVAEPVDLVESEDAVGEGEELEGGSHVVDEEPDDEGGAKVEQVLAGVDGPAFLVVEVRDHRVPHEVSEGTESGAHAKEEEVAGVETVPERRSEEGNDTRGSVGETSGHEALMDVATEPVLGHHVPGRDSVTNNGLGELVLDEIQHTNAIPLDITLSITSVVRESNERRSTLSKPPHDVIFEVENLGVQDVPSNAGQETVASELGSSQPVDIERISSNVTDEGNSDGSKLVGQEFARHGRLTSRLLRKRATINECNVIGEIAPRTTQEASKEESIRQHLKQGGKLLQHV